MSGPANTSWSGATSRMRWPPNETVGRQALVVGLRHSAATIGAEIIAEGIETPGEQGKLLELGVAQGQGYLLGRPAEASAWCDETAGEEAAQGELVAECHGHGRPAGRMPPLRHPRWATSRRNANSDGIGRTGRRSGLDRASECAIPDSSGRSGVKSCPESAPTTLSGHVRQHRARLGRTKASDLAQTRSGGRRRPPRGFGGSARDLESVAKRLRAIAEECPRPGR
jgi:hypothetical protein